MRESWVQVSKTEPWGQISWMPQAGLLTRLVLYSHGGMLADSTKTLPGLFGEKAVFGFQWIRGYPDALPSLINAVSLSIVTLIVILFLEEVSGAHAVVDKGILADIEGDVKNTAAQVRCWPPTWVST